MIEYLLRFIVGGVVVSAFVMLGDVLRPKSFAGLFGAAPSVALATLGIAVYQHGAGLSTPASLQCCGRQREQQSLRSWLPRIGSSLRCAAFSPVSFAGTSVSTLFQSKQTRGEYIASRTAKLRPPPWTGLNRRPDAQRKHRNGLPSTFPSAMR